MNENLSVVAIAISFVTMIGGSGALLQWNHARNAERDKDRDRMARLESEVRHLQSEMESEKTSMSKHMERVYAKLDELSKTLYRMMNGNKGKD